MADQGLIEGGLPRGLGSIYPQAGGGCPPPGNFCKDRPSKGRFKDSFKGFLLTVINQNIQ